MDEAARDRAVHRQIVSEEVRMLAHRVERMRTIHQRVMTPTESGHLAQLAGDLFYSAASFDEAAKERLIAERGTRAHEDGRGDDGLDG